MEIAVLGCHADAGDSPEALALAVHQLRQAPDYLDALSLPLPLHLASLTQHYVLPTVAEAEPGEAEPNPPWRSWPPPRRRATSMGSA